MEKLKQILDQLQNTSGTKAKQEIIKNNLDDELFVSTMKFLLNDFIVTGISEKKINKKLSDKYPDYSEICLESLEHILYYVTQNNTGRDCDIYIVQSFINDNLDYKEIIESLVTKSLKLGITATTWNKLVKDDDKIPVFDCMLAQKYWDNMDFVKGQSFTVTTKEDGNRCLLIKENGNVLAFTRQGQQYFGLVDIVSELEKLDTDNIVVDGELMTLKQFEMPSDLRFKETMKIVRKDGEKHGVKLIAFDYLPLEDFKKGLCKIPYIMRRESLENTFSQCKFIEPVRKLYVGNDTKKIIELLDEMVDRGEEGVMININSAPYECKRTKQLLKVKKMQTADVLVTDVYEGTGKNVGKLGGITIQFKNDKDELCSCNCGSGFSDEERVTYWNNTDLLIGKIVELQYFEISQDSKTKEYGLRFPVWKSRIRHDKNEISMY